MTTDRADGVPVVTPEQLAARLDAGEDVFVLDVRANADYDAWHIDGPGVDTANVPYFELLDGLPDTLHDALPDDRRLTVVCAKGGSSEHVAASLADAGYDVEHLADGMRGWARRYDAVELDTDGDATVVQYRRPSSGCLAYLLVSGGEAAVIDPLRAFADRYVEDAREYDATLAYALDTHVHADHVSGVRAVAESTDATAALPAPAADRGVDYDAPVETVSDGDTLTVGEADLSVVHAPGHTTGMTAYRVDDVLFTGDSLFAESVARPDLEDPDPGAARDAARTLHATLHERLLDAPDDTLVAPGHAGDGAPASGDGPVTATVGTLRERVDALSLREEAFVEAVTESLPPRPANHETVIATNLGHAAPDDETAYDLELGPNNCAVSAPDADEAGVNAER